MTDVTPKSKDAGTEADRTLAQERLIEAPRELVFKAFTDPAHLPRWFGPKGFTITTHAIDLRPGGSWHYDMHGPDGTDYPNFMRFLEIATPDRLVYDHGESPDGPPHFQVTVTLTPEGAGTRVRMQSLFPTVEACEAVKGFGAVELGQQTLAKLAELVEGLTER